MKRLVIYLLVACTILSFWIEREMTTQVRISNQKNYGFIHRRERAVFRDEIGGHFFEAIEENGLRIHEIPIGSWTEDWQGGVDFYGTEPFYRIIESASRFPEDGSKIKEATFETAEDTYLCLYPEGVPDDFDCSEIVAQNETAILLKIENGQVPFFEHTAKNLSQSLKSAEKIYSLNDAENLVKALPMLTIAMLILFLGILSTIRKQKLLPLITLCALAIILYKTNLPPSMMPNDNIFHLNHYAAQLSQITTTLARLGKPYPSNLMASTLILCIIFVAGLLMAARHGKLIFVGVLKNIDKLCQVLYSYIYTI